MEPYRFVINYTENLPPDRKEAIWEDVLDGRVKCTDFLPRKGRYSEFARVGTQRWYSRFTDLYMGVPKVVRHLRKAFGLTRKFDREAYTRVMNWFERLYPFAFELDGEPGDDFDDERYHADISLVYALKKLGTLPLANPVPYWDEGDYYYVEWRTQKGMSALREAAEQHHEGRLGRVREKKLVALGFFSNLYTEVSLRPNNSQMVEAEARHADFAAIPTAMSGQIYYGSQRANAIAVKCGAKLAKYKEKRLKAAHARTLKHLAKLGLL